MTNSFTNRKYQTEYADYFFPFYHINAVTSYEKKGKSVCNNEVYFTLLPSKRNLAYFIALYDLMNPAKCYSPWSCRKKPRLYRVGGIFPPERNYQIPWNVCTLAQKVFEWNIPMGVGYNGIKYFFNKTSASLCHRLKSSWRKRSWDTHLFLREI